ncbi:MAG: DUF2493 domain-containing protein [Clostridia bacterium]|nr:DUF2493 domain-containing protein [Clostridia bacterium]
MKLLIAGSRSIAEFDLDDYIPSNVELIITGGAKGVDTVAEKYADKHNISKLVLRPQYNRFGKGAPLKRNEEMIDIADSVLVIWDGKSRGTNYTVTKAKEKSKPITLININE